MAATLLRFLLLQAFYKPYNQDKREQKIFKEPFLLQRARELSSAKLNSLLSHQAIAEGIPSKVLSRKRVLMRCCHHCDLHITRETSRVSLPGQKSQWSKKRNLHVHVQVVRVRHVVRANFWGSPVKTEQHCKDQLTGDEEGCCIVCICRQASCFVRLGTQVKIKHTSMENREAMERNYFYHFILITGFRDKNFYFLSCFSGSSLLTLQLRVNSHPQSIGKNGGQSYTVSNFLLRNQKSHTKQFGRHVATFSFPSMLGGTPIVCLSTALLHGLCKINSHWNSQG